MKKFIKLSHNNEVMPGWTASISTAHKKGGTIAVATSDGSIYNTKEQAWASIKEKASKLDYTTNEVKFNQVAVTSYEEVLKLVKEL